MTPSAHIGPVNGLAWMSDGSGLLSTGHDEKCRLWDSKSYANRLVNYGPSIGSGRRHHSVSPVIVDRGVEDPVLFFPSEDGFILVFSLEEGYLWRKLFVTNGQVGCCVVREGWEEMYSGDSQNRILCWQPYERPESNGNDGQRTTEGVLNDIQLEMTSRTPTFS